MVHLLFNLKNEVRAFTLPPGTDLPSHVKAHALLIVEETSGRMLVTKDRFGLFTNYDLSSLLDVETWLADIGAIERKEHPESRLRRLMKDAVPGQAVKIPHDIMCWVVRQGQGSEIAAEVQSAFHLDPAIGLHFKTKNENMLTLDLPVDPVVSRTVT
jgi:hypothetical protein